MIEDKEQGTEDGIGDIELRKAEKNNGQAARCRVSGLITVFSEVQP
jgi:hypothetical protein